ncbi:hypothetical protein CONCODRAFT_78011 [Conidiobolus coronatus NRRL 28638]|uniref:Uncharacterized protein n=1 Tax=Conidiobolus coronatus (strain ATCC 28846 / CBS 209.66 / NRRL 28638) TaxID=796925 RepID=A0A137PAV2_CONC2|nr:hypothetical protein CONCODRAFT_78011 [Conidiobolus coronatus NRRL 28638]|eukprot:KXN72051.1 hypothetical protein CONCODRAFT_78011 [Conidiobolus coronatus NRRL 28638]
MPVYNNGIQVSELKSTIKIVPSSSEEYQLNSVNSIQATRDQKLYKQNSDNHKRKVLDKYPSTGFKSSQTFAAVASPLIYAFKTQKLHKDTQSQQKQVSTENSTTESKPVRNLTSNILSSLKRQFAMEAEDCIQISKTQKFHDIHLTDLESNLLISDFLHMLPQTCYSDSEDQKDDDDDDENEKDDEYFTLPSDFYDEETPIDKFSYDQEKFSKIEYPGDKKCSVRFCTDSNTIREFPVKSLPNLDRYKGKRACPPPKPAIKTYIPYEFLTARMRTKKEKILEIVTLNNTEKNSIVKNPIKYTRKSSVNI